MPPKTRAMCQAEIKLHNANRPTVIVRHTIADQQPPTGLDINDVEVLEQLGLQGEDEEGCIMTNKDIQQPAKPRNKPQTTSDPNLPPQSTLKLSLKYHEVGIEEVVDIEDSIKEKFTEPVDQWPTPETDSTGPPRIRNILPPRYPRSRTPFFPGMASSGKTTLTHSR